MKVTTVHATTIVGRCPNGGPDVYAAEFHMGGAHLEVERIQTAIDDLTRDPIFQERLTEELARRLGCRVVTTGPHHRFLTRCEADPGC